MLAIALYFAFSHVISFLCSIFEAVLLSCTPTYVALLKKRGVKTAPLLEELKGQVDRPLAAILTLNTIAHTVGAAGVGASVVETFGDKWLALASIILTLTMLYWTEMLPKTVGALYWKQLAPYCAPPIRLLIFFTYPFVVSFNFFAKLLARGKSVERISEEDVLIALEAGTQAGLIEEAEQDMVENIFRMGDRRVGVLMRPRVDIEWLDIEDSIEELRDQILASEHHRFPLCEGEIDKVIGIVHSQDLLARAWKGEEIDFRELAYSPLFVQETQHIFELMTLFRKEKTTLAIVADEYGSIQGMITMSNLMEAILKDVEQEEIEGVVKVGGNVWLVEGSVPIDEFKDYFHLNAFADEERARYRTLSGLCMSQLEAVPKKGDAFALGSYRVEVLAVRRRRVEKVLITLS